MIKSIKCNNDGVHKWVIIERKNGPTYRIRAGKYLSPFTGETIVYYTEQEINEGIWRKPSNPDKVPHEVCWIGTALVHGHPDYNGGSC